MFYPIILLFYVERPGSPSIISSEADIQASSLTVKWTAPADDGGSPITAYRVVILKGDTLIDNVNITDPGTTSHTFGGLKRATNYMVKVFARNYVFEGPAAEKTTKTKDEGKQYKYIFLFPYTTAKVWLGTYGAALKSKCPRFCFCLDLNNQLVNH